MRSFLAFGVFLYLAMAGHDKAFASLCVGPPIDPIASVNWSCFFPLEIAGVPIGPRTALDADNPRSAVCFCPSALLGGVPVPGIRVNMWEPARLIDTVSEPFCFMALGKDLDGIGNPLGKGSLHNDGEQSKTFQQMHFYMYPVFALLNIFQDLVCLSPDSFDVAMMTEVLPNWNNEAIASFLNPEAVLFANPIAALSCAADSVAAIAGRPLDPLFWCMGSWGNVYPLAGSITSPDYVQANIGLAARSIFLMGRLGLHSLSTYDGCNRIPAVIWQKSRYKLSMSRPVRSPWCVPVGRTGLIWGAGHHPPIFDNFAWWLWKKEFCCVRVIP